MVDEEQKQDKWERFPGYLKDFFLETADIAVFTVYFFKEAIRPPHEFRELLNQAYKLGYRSLLLVGISGFIIGLVMTVQSRPTMKEFGAEAWIPAMVSISLIREIGPVLTGLICAGKVGSGIGAELGSMKVTEQIDAMAVSGAKPMKFLVVTRVLAITLMLPILVFYTNAIALAGSYVGMNTGGGSMNLTLFLNNALEPVAFIDLVPATIKSVFFGFAIGIVSCYKGYNSQGGTVGVGHAANSSVVVSSLLIFIIDLMAVQITQLFY
jgi:phospholipid/cholesterol/gamma-HCH transport system permease protein